MSFLFVVAATVARFVQGNGMAGLGRWSLLPILVLAVLTGPFRSVTGSLVVLGAGVVVAVLCWATIAFGYTRWEDPKYSLVRYGLPIAAASTLGYLATGAELFAAYAFFVGPALTANYFFLAYKKPVWLQRLTRYDVAAAVAGALVGTVALV